MLAKILKGSKDKKLLDKQLELCPSYGYYNILTIKEITKIIDWMIINNYLDIDYNGRLPMIVFSGKGIKNVLIVTDKGISSLGLIDGLAELVGIGQKNDSQEQRAKKFIEEIKKT